MRTSRRGSLALVTRLTVLKARPVLLNRLRLVVDALDCPLAPRVAHDELLLDACPAQPGRQHLLVVGTGRHVGKVLHGGPSGGAVARVEGRREMSKSRKVNE